MNKFKIGQKVWIRGGIFGDGFTEATIIDIDEEDEHLLKIEGEKYHFHPCDIYTDHEALRASMGNLRFWMNDFLKIATVKASSISRLEGNP